ncbi:MAG TPA: CapA family protein [Stellaceae bacterium]|jgi:poly-gamma-glutamate capsule biosynthesis protein CapA/YwtB (metallophosphatase superfamily)|nr:CapA family protein [Stellaceae bacterium]
MTAKMILTGDVNLMNVTDPAVPFSLVRDEFRAADIVFSNLECCLCPQPSGHSVANEGFFADPAVAGEALKSGGVQAVGVANNVNYGAAAITASLSRLDEIGVPHTGAGGDRRLARAPVVVERAGRRFGFLQRSSVYWPTNHEAGDNSTGIAVIRGHTAYQIPMHGGSPPANRPGLPPQIVTWADRDYLRWFADDMAALRAQADIVVASCHWGVGREVLQYMREIAHAAIDAGADIVIGHGPHYSLPVEVYHDKPIFYGLGSFSFHTGHGGRRHGDWLGMMVRAACAGGAIERVAFQFVRHDERNRTVLRTLAEEAAAFDQIAQESAALGAELAADGDEAVVKLRA